MHKEKEIDTQECLNWPGACDKDAYGLVKIKGKQHRVHRVALEISIGRKLESGECALHICNNPNCFNPAHLVVGDIKKNNQMKRDEQITLADKFLPGWETIYG